MEITGLVRDERLETLIALVARSCSAPVNMILPYADYGNCLTSLFELPSDHFSDILAPGHVAAEVQLAADKAGRTIRELLGTSPFAADPDQLLAALTTGRETVYLANPNRITGANFGRRELEQVATAIPDGLLVVDEHYFDYYGITARPLLGRFGNIVIMRSFTSAFGVNSSAAGYLIAGAAMLDRISDLQSKQPLSSTLHRLLMTTLDNSDAKALRMKILHDESLRLAMTLTGMGMQCRISPTDFMLIRVADPTQVGNALAAEKIPIDNLDGYPQLKNYIRYTIAGEVNNNHLIDALRRMPEEIVRLSTLDRRLARLKAMPETPEPDTAVAPAAGAPPTVHRTRVVVSTVNEEFDPAEKVTG